MGLRKIFLFALLLLLPSSSWGWNYDDHQAQGRLALEGVAHEWKLDQPIEIHTLDSFLKKLPPEIGDPWHFADWLGINPAIDLEVVVPEIKEEKNPTPLQILSAYSVDPDDGRDQDLFDRDAQGRPRARYRDQKWFGALEGPDSQAFRHIEKPPFSLKHPLATFGFPFRKVGEASDRAEIWYQLSQLAFSVGEEYWGWRFLANSFHYIQDLHNPYHAGQITPEIAWRGFLNYLKWGRYKPGFIGTFARLIGNSHRFYESYVSRPLPEDRPLKEIALQRIRGKEISQIPDSLSIFTQQIRDESNHDFPELIHLVSQLTEGSLQGELDLKTDPNLEKNPAPYLTSLDRSLHEKMFVITQRRFEAAGKALRTVVAKAIEEKKSAGKREESLAVLGRLLGD